tara:strand:+ start:63 stop:386 length:324 start_codon:yes stop_codon:yes gene_type:complete
MNNLDICKRIAKIDGVELLGPNKINYKPAYSMSAVRYDPLTDDALCFQLMIKYDVELSPMFNGCWCATVAQAYTFDEQIDYRLCSTGLDENPNMAICLAIIELKKGK